MLVRAQVYAAPAAREPRVKASQCFTKYRWRDGAAALRETGPQIVATQARVLTLTLGACACVLPLCRHAITFSCTPPSLCMCRAL